METYEYKGNYINGSFIKADSNAWRTASPADLEDQIFEVSESTEHVSEAVYAAKEAFNTWKKLTIDERKTYLLKLKDIYIKNIDKLAELISRETGKPLWDTRGEANALVGKIDITLNHSLDLIKEVKVEAASGSSDGFIRYKPKGVMAIIGPFNFPAHLPNGHFIPALVTGNTVVFKPSELTPATGQLIAEMIHEAGFPKGVFNLVQGKAEVGKRLIRHQDIDGVLFTGSYETGLKIKHDTVTHYWKTLALEMGGKNSSIVWSDADMDKAIYECIFGAYASTGQRCSCTSRIILHSSIKDQFLERFHNTAKKIKIGHWREEVFFGPLISESALDKYLRFQQIAVREGAESIMRGKEIDTGYKGYYVSPSIYYINESKAESVYEHEEVFGPSVAIYDTDDLDDAISIANDTAYGLSSSIFTKDKKVYEKAFTDLHFGVINWNKPTCGASSKLPFGGEKKSGNGRPSGHFAVNYCTSPVACIEDETNWDKSSMASGVELV